VSAAVPVDLAAVFERAPLLAERVARRVRTGEDPDHIVAVAREELARFSEAERVAVLNAHPRIGASAASLSALSREEQGAEADAATLAELARLNDEYERTFGFRFVVFVHGRRKEELVPVLRSRLMRSRPTELASGLDEFLAIARDRLAKDVR
jgi:2-oxo-4-hydroxy-4-carboxy--5-ureidoimidazoline (OHCU) decarboxylase